MYVKNKTAHFFLRVIKDLDNYYFGVGFTKNAFYWGRPNCEDNNLYLSQMNLHKPDCEIISKEEFEKELQSFMSEVLNGK